MSFEANEKIKYIFVVGNSRSGTGVIARILGKHPSIYTIPHEIHFFEGLCSLDSLDQELTNEDSVILLSRLLCGAQRGYLHISCYKDFISQASTLLFQYKNKQTPINIYRFFLEYIAHTNDAEVVCEQTPRYLLATDTILTYFPDGLIINTVRDPRDILLSQKNKWRAGLMASEDTIPLIEYLRSWVNYHPVTISILWKKSTELAKLFMENERFFVVKYEDIVESSSVLIRNICILIGIPYRPDMLKISIKGSSTTRDSMEQQGVADFRDKWKKKGGLSNTEVFICEKILAAQMKGFGYNLSSRLPNIFLLMWLIILFVFKTPLAIFLNIGRTKNIWRSIINRI